jgi:hypothetical protein
MEQDVYDDDELEGFPEGQKLRIIPTDGDPLSLDVAEFGQGMIDFDRPVLGSDLEMLRFRFNLKVYDAAYLFGLNVGAWYKYTTKKTDRLEKELDRQRGKVETEIVNLQNKLEVDNLSAGDKKKISDKLEKAQKKLSGMTLETVVKRDRIEAARKEEKEGKDGPDKPVNEALALLVRFYDVKENYIDQIPLRSPSMHDCMDELSYIDENDIGLLLGRDQTSSYRWRNLTNEPQPPVKRLMVGLTKWLQDEQVSEDGLTPNVFIWQHVVEREFALRGREMGKVRNPSHKTMKNKLSRNKPSAAAF